MRVDDFDSCYRPRYRDDPAHIKTGMQMGHQECKSRQRATKSSFHDVLSSSGLYLGTKGLVRTSLQSGRRIRDAAAGCSSRADCSANCARLRLHFGNRPSSHLLRQEFQILPSSDSRSPISRTDFAVRALQANQRVPAGVARREKLPAVRADNRMPRDQDNGRRMRLKRRISAEDFAGL